MVNIKQIAEHSICPDLLTGGICIDAGCRGFQFSEAMRDLGCTVLAFDLEAMIPPEKISFLQMAIDTNTGFGFYKDTSDKQAKHLSDTGIPVAIVDINSIYNSILLDKKEVDVLKLDVEGSEYRILSCCEFKPIPRQISVEFHEHAHKHLHDQYFQACMDNLLKHYVAVKHDRYAAHGAGMNYWDSLFIRKDLI